MTGRSTQLKTEQLDMDTFFDFNQGTTPSKADATPKASFQEWNQLSPFEAREEQQQFSGPSHDYNQYKQQVGLPTGSVTNMPMANFDDYSSGIGDMGFDAGMSGWSSGIDMDSDMTMDFNNPQSSVPAMFFPPANKEADNFINPNTMGGQEEPVSRVGRLWPGMHSQQAQQAAMQKAQQSQAMQQRQVKLQAQQAHYRQAAAPQQSSANGKRPARENDPHVEQSISRLLSQMRQNSHVSSNSDDGNLLPHIARMKKDEEDMDDDERLLASEEGKKLSSKERRQLRNKVSARAFRSRRKEYITQLEGDLALKAQESASLRNQNSALIQENERYRALIEIVLRHPSFTPFLKDLSEDPSVLGILDQPQMQQSRQQTQQPPQQQQQQQQPPQQQQQQQQPPQQQQQQQQQQQPQQQDAKPDYMNFDASQLQIPQQQGQQSETVGVAMVPDNDFSKLNLNGFNNSMNFNNSYRSVNAFALTDLPVGPDPAEILFDNGRQHDSVDFASSSIDPDMTSLLAKLDGAARNLNAELVSV